MFDTRYHIFYMVAVFLMLGFGILIGASVTGPAQVRQQKAYLSFLRDQVNGKVQEGKQAKAQLGKMEDALDHLRPSLVRGRLAGKHVVLIETGDYPDASEQATAAVSDAGASVTATVILTDKFAQLSPKQCAAVTASLASIQPTIRADPDSNAETPIMAALAALLTEGTAQAADQQRLETLEGQGLISITGGLAEPNSLFVLVGGGKSDADDVGTELPARLDTLLIQQLSDAADAGATGVTIVGCEPFTAGVSFIPAYQSAGIATIDCIDRPLGQLALPFALRGGPDKDDYGLKATAKRTLPSSLEGTAGL